MLVENFYLTGLLYLNTKFLKLFSEFEEQKTLESRFAKAIDAFDAVVHELDYKEDWKGWSEVFLVNKKLKFFKEFPELKKAFMEVLDYLRENDYLRR